MNSTAATRFALQIELGDEAMQTDDDVAGALEAVAAKLRNGRSGGQIMDVNGNTVGTFGPIDTDEL